MDIDGELKLMALARGDIPAVKAPLGACLADAASVCLAHEGHSEKVSLVVLGEVTVTYRLVCSVVDEQTRWTWNDLQDATEWGACGIAILLICHMTPHTVINRARKGNGFDYWLGRTDDQGLPFQNTARLEVSGILHGSRADLDARVRVKQRQVARSDAMGLPAYVIVVEFSEPAAKVVSNDDRT